jgi:hypothetical protein
MSTARTLLVLFAAIAIGLIGYQIGVSQNLAVQIPAGAAPAAYPYWYGPHFGFGFFGLLFPLFFFFIFVGLISAALRGRRGWDGHGYGHDWRRARLEELHRELHGEKPQSSGTSSTST